MLQEFSSNMDVQYLLNHKTSWVFEEDIVSSYVENHLFNSHKEVIKIEELEDQPGSTLTSDKNIAFIQKENLVAEKSIKSTKGFICNECGKWFAYQSGFNRHMLVHSGENKFSCNLCEKTFIRKSNLNQHMVIHSGVKAFSCELCDKTFATKSNLNKHMVIHSVPKK